MQKHEQDRLEYLLLAENTSKVSNFEFAL